MICDTLLARRQVSSSPGNILHWPLSTLISKLSISPDTGCWPSPGSGQLRRGVLLIPHLKFKPLTRVWLQSRTRGLNRRNWINFRKAVESLSIPAAAECSDLLSPARYCSHKNSPEIKYVLDMFYCVCCRDTAGISTQKLILELVSTRMNSLGGYLMPNIPWKFFAPSSNNPMAQVTVKKLGGTTATSK